MSYAAAACEALRAAMARDPGVVVLGEDVGRGGVFQQYRGLQAEFGAARVIDVTPVAATSRSPREASRSDKATEARVKGYEGEACGECGNFTLVRNGTCLKCNTCGGTSGCS